LFYIFSQRIPLHSRMPNCYKHSVIVYWPHIALHLSAFCTHYIFLVKGVRLHIVMPYCCIHCASINWPQNWFCYLQNNGNYSILMIVLSHKKQKVLLDSSDPLGNLKPLLWSNRQKCYLLLNLGAVCGRRIWRFDRRCPGGFQIQVKAGLHG
jgi:hypothetical protein